MPPGGKFFIPKTSTFGYLIAFFNFNFLALAVSEILGGPKFTLGGPTPPGRPLAEKSLYLVRVLHNM